LVPGRISTERIKSLDQINASKENKSIEQISIENLKLIPAGRLGKTEEYGSTAAFLASTHSSYMTGSVIRVDGGLISNI
ncbi:MAG: SDR family oxidoreductase, partial [Polynucleobacter sp.]